MLNRKKQFVWGLFGMLLVIVGSIAVLFFHLPFGIIGFLIFMVVPISLIGGIEWRNKD